MSVEIYIKVNNEYKRIDLFKDETISVNSSIQNINDLSKVFTDFSQSFTIPASPNNNIIFNYWNDNGIVNDTFDHRIRYDAKIELDTIPFRNGQIQIEKANEKENEIESFTITFYGQTKQLKDLFKEEELSVLDYSSLNHTYTYSEVIGRIDGSILDDVRYPIINPNRRYEYLTGSANDVTIGGALNRSVVFSDLFPAIPVSRIFEFIGNRYGISFEGFFLNTIYFTDLYLYCKNSENTINYTPPVKINWTSVSATFPELDLTNDTYFAKFSFQSGAIVDYQKTEIIVTPTNPAIQYKVVARIYDNPAFANGSIFTTFNGLVGTQTLLFVDWWRTGAENIQGKFTFEVESAQPMTFSAEMVNVKYRFTSGITSETRRGYSTSQTTANNINIQTYLPKIKVVDFVMGIVKMFNLTIIPKGINNFELAPLDLYYAFGKYTDITPYVVTDSIDINRPKLFKKLTFMHEKSDNILNNAFRNLFNREYGDLEYSDLLSNESSSYEIKSPFENVMFEKTTGYNFVTASLIDKDQNAYKPKPMLMYMNEGVVLPTPIQFFDGTNYNSVSTYRKFSNELITGSTIASLNWGEEQSVNNPNALATNGLFFLWYKNYIGGLYDIRCRILNLKTKMPVTMLTDIKLNDRIVYKDRKYTINNFTSNLINGEVNFELITDFRPVEQPFALKTRYNLSAEAQDIQVSVFIGNNEEMEIDYGGPVLYFSTTDINANISVLANTTRNIKKTQVQIQYFNNKIVTSTRFIDIIQKP
jgi:hypothetical protein